jgi:hypothetical protein
MEYSAGCSVNVIHIFFTEVFVAFLYFYIIHNRGDLGP